MNQLIGQLRAWQFREWLYAALFAVAVTLAVAVVLLAAACATDWAFDRYADTPLWLKLPLTFVLVFGTLGAAYLLFRRVRAPALDDLAGRAEAAFPEVEHRFVTSLQLTRRGAKTAGMSPQLIDAVVDEAGTLAKKKRLAALADASKLGTAALVFFPLLLVVGVAALLFGSTILVLLQRQLYIPIDIPRSVTIVAETRELWASGDAVTLRVRAWPTEAADGDLSEADTGVVLVSATAEDGTERPTETYELAFAGWVLDANKNPTRAAFFEAKLPPSSEPFTFHARLGDGRTRTPGTVRFVPRPVVLTTDAYVRMPEYVDPAGKRRYERIAPAGEVTAHRDCGVRVVAGVSKPTLTATLVLLGRDPGGAEVVLDTKPMAIRTELRQLLDPKTGQPVIDNETGQPKTVATHLAEASFDLTLPPVGPRQPPRTPSAYRIDLREELDAGKDADGKPLTVPLTNANPPRRGITLAPDDPPRVALLDEVNKDPGEPGALDEFEVRGIPLRMSDKVAIGYRASSPLGLLHAHLVYRVNDETEWWALPLTRVDADEKKVGRFIPELGLFETYTYTQSVQFYPIPSADPESEPSGLTAGGKYVFPVTALKKLVADGKLRAKDLEVGDRVEFYVAVYDRKFALLPVGERERLEMLPNIPPAGAASGSGDRPPLEAVGVGRRPPGVSESRIKKIVSPDEFKAWIDQRERSKESLRRIEDLQRGVSGQKK